MRVVSLELGPFAARCVLLACESTGDAAVVDPGFEPEAVVEAVRREQLRPVAVVLTHAHLDHAWGVAHVKAAFPNAPLMMHDRDLPLYENLPGQAVAFGFPAPEVVPPEHLLHDGETLPIGEEGLLVRHCPGHSPGHIVLVHAHPTAPLAVVGDVLFAGSVGRTDLWGGSFEQLERSIREVLYRLPNATRVVPGHGPETTVGAEKESNSFVPG
ncbi:MAG: MBL fold metallo-hydrolase [Acidobacteriia bacterium]|nr:MBL fold metallo-hydrolase [Terriglobia bacterium]